MGEVKKESVRVKRIEECPIKDVWAFEVDVKTLDICQDGKHIGKMLELDMGNGQKMHTMEYAMTSRGGGHPVEFWDFGMAFGCSIDYDNGESAMADWWGLKSFRLTDNGETIYAAVMSDGLVQWWCKGKAA